MAVTLNDDQVKTIQDALKTLAQNSEPEKINVPNYLSQHWLSLVSFVVLIGVAWFSFSLTPDDGVKIWNKIFSVSLFWLLALLFELFYNGIQFQQHESISKNPSALAVYLGATLIGTALIVALS